MVSDFVLVNFNYDLKLELKYLKVSIHMLQIELSYKKTKMLEKIWQVLLKIKLLSIEN